MVESRSIYAVVDSAQPTWHGSDRSEGATSVDISWQEASRAFLGEGEGLLGASRVHRTLKRLVDVVVSFVAIALLSPVILITAALVKLTSRGPVFHVQQRLGQNGDPIRFVKFRTMQCDAHDLKPALLDLNECSGPVFKIRNDPRVTTLGGLLRRLSIDELPQLFLVLKGDMTLIGPRPALPEEVSCYGPWEWQRLLVKPGITCIWQVSGRADLPFETWVNLDIAYIRQWSPSLDAKILAMTIPAVLSGRGAY